MLKLHVIFVCFCVLLTLTKGENDTGITRNNKYNQKNYEISGSELVQQARTFTHKAFKRLMLIAPAIFFKLGIAFTLLILVTLAAVNNGFIGFLILVVGLSSVLARFQGNSTPAVQQLPIASTYAAPLPQIPHYHHPWIDRSDVGVDTVQKPKRNSAFFGNYDSNSDLRNTGVYYTNHQMSEVKI